MVAASGSFSPGETSRSEAESDFGACTQADHVMCHHYEALDELTEAERQAVLEEHDLEELEAEHGAEELRSLELEA